MARVLFMMPQTEIVDPLLTKEEIRGYHDSDLLQLIALTDAVMYTRPLTDTEKHNFWLVIDERRDRASCQQSR
jgi:hypothetical protein